MPQSPHIARLGRYQLLRELGHGAMGIVYEATDTRLNRRVALKTARRELLTGPGGSPELLERFFREARVAGKLAHPNIITVYDAGEQDGIAFIAMEYVDGTDLGSRLARGPRFSPGEAAELAATLAEALAYAHDNGVVHRDIKPANILLPACGPAKLADFGVAHVIDSTLTQEGALIGTPSYMSPEQFMGNRVDGRSDLFSLGAVLYEMLTGERPFTGAAFSTVMHHVLNTDPPHPQELNYAVSRDLGDVIKKSLSKAPQDRFCDGRQFAEALRTAVADHPVSDQTPSAPDTDPPHPGLLEAPARPRAMETVPGPPPPGALVTDSEAAPAGLTSVSIAAKRHRGRDLTVPAVLVALAVLLGGAYLLRPAAQRAPQDTHAPATYITPSDPIDQTRLRVAVYATAQDDAYFRYQQLLNTGGDTEAFIREAETDGHIQLLRGAGYSIRVYDALQPSKPFVTEALSEDGSALLQLPDGASRITFEVYSDKTSLLTVELPAEACQRPQHFLVLCPNCILAPAAP